MLHKNKCMKCGKPATNKITKIENGQVMDYYLCAEHASEASPYLKGLPLSSILENLLKKNEIAATPETPVAATKPGLRCTHCGLLYDSYKKNFMLGCSECYVSFHDDLIADLRKIHGSTHHIGRTLLGGEANSISAPAPSAQVLQHEAAGLVGKPASATAGGDILVKDPRQAIHELNKAMQNAIAAEDYTRAAIYRDQISELKQRLKKES